jgi:hypothetical protein
MMENPDLQLRLCEYCGKSFWVNLHSPQVLKKFCTKQCYHSFRAKNNGYGSGKKPRLADTNSESSKIIEKNYNALQLHLAKCATVSPETLKCNVIAIMDNLNIKFKEKHYEITLAIPQE